jgi:hypothetical protein
MNTEQMIISMIARSDPPMAAARLLGALAAIVDRMDNDDERVRVAWHLCHLAARIDPDMACRRIQ